MINDLDILKKYENHFRSAINSNYCRAIWKSDIDVLVSIYTKWTNTKPNLNMSCSKCKLDFIKKIGKLYYTKLEEYEKSKTNKTREKKKNIKTTPHNG